MSSFLRNASIGLKVSIAPAVAIVCLAVVAMAGWMSSRNLSHELQQMAGEGLNRVIDADAFANKMGEIHQTVYQSLTWEAIGQRAEKIKALDEELTKDLPSFGQRVHTAAQDSRLDDEQRATMTAFAQGYDKYAKLVVDALDIKTAGVGAAASFVVTLDAQYRENLALIRKFVGREQAATAAAATGAAELAQHSSWIIGSVSLVALGLSALLAALFARNIVLPLHQAAGLARQVAQGDLTPHQVPSSGDATGRVLQALNEVSQNLAGIVADIRRTAVAIDCASGEIASGNADLAARTENNASALQQAAASLEQLSATIRHSADNARSANQLAADASRVAREGEEMVTDVVITMDAINTQAKKIGEIIAVIDGIAFQTNILALNAAVEAARAGEQGRGFSVVASEVRNLAQRSSDAAREIRTLISSSVEQIDAGADKVQAAGQSMGRIVDAIQKVAQTVQGISDATSEQASGIAQINQTVADMDRATQQNAAMVEQASAATASLRQQASGLVQLLTRFRIA